MVFLDSRIDLGTENSIKGVRRFFRFDLLLEDASHG